MVVKVLFFGILKDLTGMSEDVATFCGRHRAFSRFLNITLTVSKRCGRRVRRSYLRAIGNSPHRILS